MSKIIKIDGNTVFIGTDNGQIVEAKKEDCGGFMPTVGDEVITYTTGDKVIVTKSANSSYGNYNEDEPHVVNKITYGLLALFLGGIGVHKFYAGYTAQGVLYLLFCWTCIPSIIALVEGIVAITKKGEYLRV
ncbi:MAG: TM2 domain-containing protein [bacterium]|nr:TM2 domain-containing protein [bacterium]